MQYDSTRGATSATGSQARCCRDSHGWRIVRPRGDRVVGPGDTRSALGATTHGPQPGRTARRPVHYVVPTGNFGRILAGDVARRLGLPVGRPVLISNDNDLLPRFFETGRTERRDHLFGYRHRRACRAPTGRRRSGPRDRRGQPGQVPPMPCGPGRNGRPHCSRRGSNG